MVCALHFCQLLLVFLHEGSIPGAFIFLLFVNDLPSYTKSFPSLLFADDCKCVGTIKSPSNQMLLKFRRTWINSCSGHINGFFCSTSPSINHLGSLTRFPSHQVNHTTWQLWHTLNSLHNNVTLELHFVVIFPGHSIIIKCIQYSLFFSNALFLHFTVKNKCALYIYLTLFTSHIQFPCLKPHLIKDIRLIKRVQNVLSLF